MTEGNLFLPFLPTGSILVCSPFSPPNQNGRFLTPISTGG